MIDVCPLCGETVVTDGERTWCNGDQCPFGLEHPSKITAIPKALGLGVLLEMSSPFKRREKSDDAP